VTTELWFVSGLILGAALVLLTLALIVRRAESQAEAFNQQFVDREG